MHSPLIVELVTWFALAIIVVGLSQTALYIFQIGAAAWAMFRNPPENKSRVIWQRYNALCPPISLIVPAFNEALTIKESLTSLTSLEYPNFEVVVVNDGSLDNTRDLIIEEWGLVPDMRYYDRELSHQPIKGLYTSADNRLTLVDKRNGGKADAQNAGVNVSKNPLVCVIDGDSVLEPDALLRAVRPFIEDPDRVIAVGGTIRLANGSTFRNGRVSDLRLPNGAISMFQVVEYLRAFLIARLAWSSLDTLMLISGAFSMFRKKELVEVGGFTPGSLGEDLDVVVKLHKHMRDQKRDYRIGFVPDPVCWTEAPESLKILSRQRLRWQKGAIEVFWRYRHMLFNPRYGRIGLLGFAQLLIFDILGPIAEALGYILLPILWALGLLSIGYSLSFLGLVFTFGVFTSVMSVLLAEMESHRYPRPWDLVRLTYYAILENFGYRQLNTWWRIKAMVQYCRSDRSWGEMPRAGFAS